MPEFRSADAGSADILSADSLAFESHGRFSRYALIAERMSAPSVSSSTVSLASETGLTGAVQTVD